MANKTYFHITVAGQPQRLYINSSTKERCAVNGSERIEGPSEFASEGDAKTKADAWGLAGYGIDSITRDIGKPTRLTQREIGF